MRVLITGAGGFVGTHLAAHLRDEQTGVELYGLLRPGAEPARLGPEFAQALSVELESPADVEAAVRRVAPERIVHLAAQSSVHDSWADPAGTWRTNVMGLAHLLEAVRRQGLHPRVLVVGSADEYGPAPPGAPPLGEDAPLSPRSPYAASKVAQGYLALQYALGYRLHVVRTRTFPHTGPGRGPSFAESSFARQLAEVGCGRRPPVVRVGNLEAVRDFSDVRDVVAAYWALLERGESGAVYNVCSGRGIGMQALLDELVELAGLEVRIEVDPARLRPSDLPVLVGDPGRLRAATGWEPAIPLRRTLADLLADWRRRVAGEAAASRPG